MDHGCMYEDSMKYYIAQVVSGKHAANSYQQRCSQSIGHHFPIPSTIQVGSGIMTTVSSQVFGNESDEKQYNDDSVKNDHQLQFELKHLVTGTKTSVVCMVKETFPIKEIWLKRRRCWIPTGVMMLCDSSGFELELLLWGKQCKHLLFTTNGSIVMLTDPIVDDFQGRKTLKLKSYTKVSKLGHICEIESAQNFRNCKILVGECRKLRDRYCSFMTSFKSQRFTEKPLVKFSRYFELKPGCVTHIRAKISSFSVTGDIYSNKSLRITISPLHSSTYIFLYLHGSAKLWKKKLIIHRTETWEFYYLAACSSVDEKVEFHTTIISLARPAFDNDDSTTDSEKEIPTFTNLCCVCDYIRDVEEIGTHLELSHVKTTSALLSFCQQLVILTPKTPEHLVENCIKKCENLSKKMKVLICASCTFVEDDSDAVFELSIESDKFPGQDLRRTVQKLLAKESSMTVGTREDTARNHIIKFNLISLKR